ncbi:hypothetical protein NUW54_g7962 [Trametes sanguinea]|uniref:Uncharacterized protein n=1 Tax=Trametes sanguinea TaxID=158606 RepID=A0ACC1PJ81_9APHY|nr:hypothetical protein NUW54_g7962 [Trametes sanguinea]
MRSVQTIQIPVPPRPASQSASASALRPAFLSALRIAFHCVCNYREVPANSVANSVNSANQVCASIASCEAREDREAPWRSFPSPIPPLLAKRRAANPREDS